MIVIVDYGLGNLFSVAKAFEFLGAEAKISGDPDEVRKADRLVLPGVGAFGDGMAYLTKKNLVGALTDAVLEKKKPFLGICLGLQLLADRSFEYGEHQGLGWIHGTVQKLAGEGLGLKIPQVGWNDITVVRESPVLKKSATGSDFYYVHSYQLICDDPKDVIATSVYGETVTAAIQHENIFATQFHPEKSQEAGLKVLENFIQWSP